MNVNESAMLSTLSNHPNRPARHPAATGQTRPIPAAARHRRCAEARWDTRMRAPEGAGEGGGGADDEERLTGRLRVGCVWGEGINHDNDKFRSISNTVHQIGWYGSIRMGGCPWCGSLKCESYLAAELIPGQVKHDEAHGGPLLRQARGERIVRQVQGLRESVGGRGGGHKLERRGGPGPACVCIGGHFALCPHLGCSCPFNRLNHLNRPAACPAVHTRAAVAP